MSNLPENSGNNTENPTSLDLQPTRGYQQSTSPLPQEVLLRLASSSPKDFVKLAGIIARRDVQLAKSADRTAVEFARIELEKARLAQQGSQQSSPEREQIIPPAILRQPSHLTKIIAIQGAVVAAIAAVALGYTFYLAKKDQNDSLHNKIDIGRGAILADGYPEAQIDINNRADLEQNLAKRFEELLRNEDVFVDNGLMVWREDNGGRLRAHCTDCCPEGYTCMNMIDLDIRGTYRTADGIIEPPYVSISTQSQYGNNNNDFGATDIFGDGLPDAGYVDNEGELQPLDNLNDQGSVLNVLLREIAERTRDIASL